MKSNRKTRVMIKFVLYHIQMKVFHSIDSISQINNPVLTIGTFDGVHLGHQKILKKLVEQAKNINGESVLLTFYPHPRMVLYPENHGLQLIQTQEEKLASLEKTGLDNVVILPFSKEFSRISAWDFVRDILINAFNIHTLVIGYDHQFGKNREGNINYLKDMSHSFDFNLVEISAKEINDVNISSTKIRKSLQNGKIEVASSFLGRPFLISGTVVKGDGLGKTIGYPTANIDINDDTKLIPQNGVYGVEVQGLSDKYFGLMNIGIRPSIQKKKNELRIEVYIFNMNKDIYEKRLKICLIKKIRSEMKFDSLELLKKQITNDEIAFRDYITEHTPC